MSTILIVEDNAMNMKLARDVLEAKGYTVFAAETGEDGVRMAADHVPDLILMDIQLPGIDGIEAFAQIRAETSTAAIPVIAFTASVTTSDRGRVQHFDAFVSKPIDLKSFLATVERFIGQAG